MKLNSRVLFIFWLNNLICWKIRENSWKFDFSRKHVMNRSIHIFQLSTLSKIESSENISVNWRFVRIQMTLQKDFVLLDWVQFADFLKFLAVHSLSSICEKISLCEKVLKHLSCRMTEFVWVKSVFFGILEFSLFCPFFFKRNKIQKN